MNCRQVEPTLADTLADPVIRALMAADGVDPQALETVLRRLARQMLPMPRNLLPCRDVVAQC